MGGRRGRALPYATELPMGATYYILERHPDLRETPAGIITRAEQEACPGATDARAFVHAIREIAPEPPSSALRHALLGVAAALFFPVLYLMASCGVCVSHWCRDYWDPDARAVSRIKRIRASLGRL